MFVVYLMFPWVNGRESIVHHPAQQQARKFELGHLPDERSMDGSTNHSLSYNVIVEV